MNNNDKLLKIKEAILEWDGHEGHDRCWYYPDLYKKIADILEVKLKQEPVLPPEEYFKEGCRRYREEQYKKFYERLQTGEFVV